MRCSLVLVLIVTNLLCSWVEAVTQSSVDIAGAQQAEPLNYCKEAEFQCRSYPPGASKPHCIALSWKCDGEQDCADGSDEAPELCKPAVGVHECGPDAYTCNPVTPLSKWSKCVPKAWVCDGRRDCPHNDDEKNCVEPQCHPTDEFRCVSGDACIEKRQVCDYADDCSDGSDEANCASDGMNSESVKSNSKNFDDDVALNDTGNKSSSRQEKTKKSRKSRKTKSKKPALVGVKESVCTRDEFECVKGNVSCVLMVQQCNGDNDCEDGSDEEGCSCMPHEFTCNDGRQCVDKFARCNGTVECRDASDEQKCELMLTTLKCDANKEFNCGDGVCISNAAVCDFINDCPNAADEDINLCWEKCKNTCHHHCMRGPQPYCACHRGYKLKPDMVGCEDVDECLTPDACSHRCINTPGAYTCTCADDYILEVSPDAYIGSGQNLTIDDAWFMRSQYELETHADFFKQRRSIRQTTTDGSNGTITGATRVVRKNFCKARYGGTPDFLVIRANEVLLYNSTTHRVRTLQKEQQAPYSVDYHYGDRVMVWTDMNEKCVYRASMSSPGMRTKIAEGVGVDSVAVDWIHKHVYFTDPKRKKIEVVYLHPEQAMNETGKYVKITVVKEGLMAPRAIQLDPEEGWMYWSDWSLDAASGKQKKGTIRTGKIERAGMDGSRREQIWPPARFLDSTGTALALDTPSEYYIYWVNGLALDRINQRLYFVDAWNRNANAGGKLASIRVDGTDYRFIMSSAQSLKYVVGITLWEDDIIWADYEGDGVAACNKFRGDRLRHIFGGQNKSIDGIRSTPAIAELASDGRKKDDMRMYDVKAVHPLVQRSSKLTDESACARGTHGCSHMCLPVPRNDNLLINLVSDFSRHFSSILFGSSNSTTSSSASSLRWRCVCPRMMQLALDHKTCAVEAAFAQTTGRAAVANVTVPTAPLAYGLGKYVQPVVHNDKALDKDSTKTNFAAASHQVSTFPFHSNHTGHAGGDHEAEDEESVFYIWLLVAIIAMVLLIMTSIYCICREPGDDPLPVHRTPRPNRVRLWQRQVTNRLTDFAAGSGANRSQFKHHRLHSPSISASIAGGERASTILTPEGDQQRHHNHHHAAAASIDDDDIVFQDIDFDEGDIIDGPYAKPKKHERNNSLMPTGSSPPLNKLLSQRKSSAGRIVLDGAGTLLSQVRRISYSKRSRNNLRNPSFDLGPTSSKVANGDKAHTMPAQPIYQLSHTPPGSLPIEEVLGTCASSTASTSTSSLVLEDGLPLVTNQV